MSDSSSSAKVQIGPGVMGTLAIVFTIAKLMGKIDWSWWLVLAPIWAPAAIVFTIFIVGAALAVIFTLLSD